jgi:brefeldin A-resistance guanine nucleotide exchange factor 1
MLWCVSDLTRPSVPATVENIADAVTHARFVGTDQASDGVVLMKILQVVAFNCKSYCNIIIHPEGKVDVVLELS